MGSALLAFHPPTQALATSSGASLTVPLPRHNARLDIVQVAGAVEPHRDAIVAHLVGCRALVKRSKATALHPDAIRERLGTSHAGSGAVVEHDAERGGEKQKKRGEPRQVGEVHVLRGYGSRERSEKGGGAQEGSAFSSAARPNKGRAVGPHFRNARSNQSSEGTSRSIQALLPTTITSKITQGTQWVQTLALGLPELRPSKELLGESRAGVSEASERPR